jgi:pyrroloquinoline-quinone synthase
MSSFFTQLEDKIEKKQLLHHPFYKAWSRGELSLEVLQEYAKEYYHHVKAFPTYLSQIHARTEDSETRKAFLQNLIEEEAGSPNHPELWREFIQALQVQEEEIAQHKPSQAIEELIQTFRSIAKKETVAAAIASLYAYESQIPAICVSKIEGLEKQYGFSKEMMRYFTIHIAADEEHARVERELLAKHVTKENEEAVLQAADRVLQKLWDFLSSLTEKHHITCSC